MSHLKLHRKHKDSYIPFKLRNTIQRCMWLIRTGTVNTMHRTLSCKVQMLYFN